MRNFILKTLCKWFGHRWVILNAARNQSKYITPEELLRETTPRLNPLPGCLNECCLCGKIENKLPEDKTLWVYKQ